MAKPVLILANPIAGGGRAKKRAPELRAALRARGIDGEVRFSERSGDLHRLAGEATADRCRALVVMGGDGSLNEALNGMPDLTVPLATTPLGTANVLACELRLPRKIPAIADAIAQGRTQPMAVGTAAGRRFLLFASAGLDGQMVEELERTRTGTLGKWKWVAPVLRVVRRLPRHRIRIETDAGAVRDDLTQALVTRVRSYGGVFRMPACIDPCDGLLHVVCFSQTSRWQWLRAAFAAWLWGLRDGVHCEVLRAQAVTIRCDEPVPYHVDGDFGGRAPIEVGLLPEPARVVIP